MLHFKKFPFSVEKYTRPSLNVGSEFHKINNEVRKMLCAVQDMARSKEIHRFDSTKNNEKTIADLDELLAQVGQLRSEGKMAEAGQKLEEAVQFFGQEFPNLGICHPGILVFQGIAALDMQDPFTAFECFQCAVENEWCLAERRRSENSKLRHFLQIPLTFFKAPTANKTEAEIRFHRLLPQIDYADNELLEKVYMKRQNLCELVKNGQRNKEFRFSMRKSYIEMLYNTVAIEGVQVTIDEAYQLLKNGLKEALSKQEEDVNDNDSELRKLLSTAKAYALIWQRLEESSLTLEVILEMHNLVMSGEDEILAEKGGKLRDDCAISRRETEKHMLAIIQWANDGMRQIKKGKTDPFLVASLAHCFLILHHGFEDGNGRISRCVMNYILMCAGFPPVVVPKAKKLEYIDMLITGRRGNFRPFIRFICQCAMETMDKIIRSSNVAEIETVEGGRGMEDQQNCTNYIRPEIDDKFQQISPVSLHDDCSPSPNGMPHYSYSPSATTIFDNDAFLSSFLNETLISDFSFPNE